MKLILDYGNFSNKLKYFVVIRIIYNDRMIAKNRGENYYYACYIL